VLRIDVEKKEVRVVDKGACRRMNMHFEWGPLLNLFLIHVVGQVFESMPEASMGCPWVGQNERKKDKSGKVIVGRSIHNQYLHKNLSFLSGFKST
jgi:hypothetical protein